MIFEISRYAELVFLDLDCLLSIFTQNVYQSCMVIKKKKKKKKKKNASKGVKGICRPVNIKEFYFKSVYSLFFSLSQWLLKNSFQQVEEPLYITFNRKSQFGRSECRCQFLPIHWHLRIGLGADDNLVQVRKMPYCRHST